MQREYHPLGYVHLCVISEISKQTHTNILSIYHMVVDMFSGLGQGLFSSCYNDDVNATD